MQLFSLIVCFSIIAYSQASQSLLYAKIAFQGYKVFDEIWEIYNCKGNLRYCLKNKNEKVLDELDQISDDVYKLNAEATLHYKQTINQLLSLEDKIAIEIQSAEILKLISRIEEAYTLFSNYFGKGFNGVTSKHKYYDISTIQDFTYATISHNPLSVRMSLEDINKFINRPESEKLFRPKSFFQSVRNYYQNGTNACQLDRTVQQLIFDMYTMLQTTQLKAYTMIQVSWLFLQVQKKGNFEFEAGQLSQKYVTRLKEQAQTIIDDVSKTSNVFLKCDPPKHEKDVTYTEITRFMQGYLVNEIDLNEEKTCKDDCSYFHYGRQHGCHNDEFCLTPACRGNVYNCVQMEEDMDVCPSYQPDARRIDWMEYSKGTRERFGLKNHSCKRAVKKANYWLYWGVFWCNYCMCYCDDPNDLTTHRFFNLREVNSDVSNNKIVTGVRMTKVNKVFQMQIQEGRLEKNGYINSSALQWKLVESYSVESTNVSLGRDYHMLLPEKNAIDLDDLHLPEHYAVTGVRFRVLGGNLNLEIRGTKFNFTSGVLRKGADVWISNDNTIGAPINPRTELVLDKPGNPAFQSEPSIPDSTSDQFVRFAATDLHKDAAQTTVPMFDIQTVAPNPPIPLSGVGIYHKGRKGSGGFIGLKVFNYDVSRDVENFLPFNDST